MCCPSYDRQVSEVTTVPRTIQEILDHADDPAERFEGYEPRNTDEQPVEDYVLRRAALNRARSEQQVIAAVVTARSAGLSWTKIGAASAQAAQQRYGIVVEAV